MNKLTTFLLSATAAAALSCHSAYSTPAAGEPAPDFSAQGCDGKTHSLSEYKGKYVVLEWTNPQCPFVKKQYDSSNMQKLQKEYTGKGVAWLTIDSAAPGNGGSLTADEAKKWGKEENAAWTTLITDSDGKIGTLYGAKATPTMVIISPEGKVLYEGAIDSIASADPADIDKATNYVKQGLDEAMAGKPLTTTSTKAYGCGVKYAR